MADVFSREKRSQVMRQVKGSRNRSTELKLIAFFKAYKITGWRRGYPLFGKPDFVFLSLKLIVFVDGCFWHGHDCRKINPEQNKKYWKEKIKRNMQRDKEVAKYLRQSGWTVRRIWECELKKERLVKKKLSGKLAHV